MEGIKPPKNLILTGEGANWKKFKQLFTIYLQATGLATAAEDRKIAIFLNCAGEEAIDVYNAHLDDKCKAKLETILVELDKYSEPRKNLVLNTYELLHMRQDEGESIDHYVTRLKTKASKCELENLENRMLAMMVVIGANDTSVKERLLREDKLSLQQALSVCRAAEAGRKQVQAFEKPNIYAVKTKSEASHGARPKQFKCQKCSKTHEYKMCPAYGKKCLVCGKYNHFAAMCRVGKDGKVQNSRRERKVHILEEDSDSEQCEGEEEEFCIDSLKVDSSKTQNEWRETIKVNGSDISFKLDSGADCNTLSLELYNKIKDKNVKLTDVQTVLIVYNGEKVKTVGCVELECVVRGRKENIKFSVIDLPVKPVIGLPDCVRLKFLCKLDEMTQSSSDKLKFIHNNKDVFKGLGNIGTYKIKLCDEAIPVIKPIRRVPQAIKDRLKLSLDNYERRDIIEKVEGPTSWCNNLVIVEKPDKSLRLCLDPQELNKNILRENFQIPSPEEIYNNLTGKAVFTVLDMKDGFFQILLDDEQKVCTFGTPFGRYRFKRMPFGISSAPEVMQRINSTIFSDIQGVELYFDDLIVAGKDKHDHDRILNQVIDRARKYNVKFNSKKLQYRCDHVKYVGLIISKAGLQVDPDHVKAILDLEEPKNVKQLQKFLGMCNYLCKFIPQYSKTTEPMRNLLRKDIEWNWGINHAQAFLEIKKKLSCSPTLAILDNKGPIVLQTDSSKSGMGACLLQSGKPISFYSRCYTECQTRWAPIEKELFAICAAMEKYHQFVYGRRIVVETDHKPLVAIMSKDINKISARLQRMVLKLLKYDFEIKYIPGSQMYVADYLSRNYSGHNAKVEPSLKELVHCLETDLVHCFELDLPISESKLMQLQKETKNDCNLEQILNWHNTDWPKNDKNIVNKELKTLYKLKDLIHVKDNVIYYNNRILIPKQLRQEMLMIVHSGHAGVVKCKKRARKVLFWPGMSQDIQHFVLSCKSCEKFRPSNPKQSLMSHDIPDLPFHKIGMDICHFAGKDYLVVVDYYSKWIEVNSLKNKTADNVIKKLKSLFATHGIPKYIVSDNMPFGSYTFTQFAKTLEIKLITSSPRYPQSNGLAEKAVGIVKCMMRKCKDTNSDFSIAMLHYRTTPVAGLEYSPSELLMSRLLRTNLPCTKTMLQPNVPTNVKLKYNLYSEKSKSNYNKTARDKKSFSPGDDIVFQNVPEKLWNPGKIINNVGPRSFTVKSENGNVVRRNERHINLSKNKMIVKSELDFPSGSLIQEPEETHVNRSRDQTIVTTRSGRQVRPPSYLSIYKTY